VILLVGIVGGLSMASIAGARRTQSSFPAYLASSNPSDLGAATAVFNPGQSGGYNPGLVRRIAHLPHVERVASEVGIDVLPLGRNDKPLAVGGFSPQAGAGLGSVNGLGFSSDRLTVVQGKMADPRSVNQVMVLQEVAQFLGFHVGEHILLGIYTNAQTLEPRYGSAAIRPYKTFEVTITALVVQPHNLVEDDVDNSISLLLFTPAFTKPLINCCVNYTETGIKVRGGANVVATVDNELVHILPKAAPDPIEVASTIAKAERAIKPESIALGVFGMIAALAALLIGAQVIGRQIRLGTDDLRTMRALGADPLMTSTESLVGLFGAIALGSVLAFAVAIGLSPLAPLGPVRPVDPTPGISLDWTVLGFGVLVLVVGLGMVATVLSLRAATRLGVEQDQRSNVRTSRVVSGAVAAGLPPAAATGVRFALEPGTGRSAVPVRSAILGAALAVIVVVSTVTFGASLNSLVSNPKLYGWNWDYLVWAGGGSGNMPLAQATKLFNADPYIQSWSAAYSGDLQIDGQAIPVLGERAGTAVQPPTLSGRRLDRPDQVVLGAITLAQLHKHLGQTITVGSGRDATNLRIVGMATMPAIGGPGPHLEMGTGALLSYQLIPAAARNLFNDPVSGPEMVFVSLKPGANHAAAVRSLNAVSAKLSNNFNFGVMVQEVLRPAEIVNYRSLGTTPAVLGGALAGGAVVALGLTLVASVRRRRRDLAMLKTLGFTGRQLASVVSWQATVSVACGVVIGIPLGIVIGRALWTLFATNIDAVPAPTVPILSIVVIGVGALFLANIVAAVPGRAAARTSTAVLLRTD
jgi:hypothetical protein